MLLLRSTYQSSSINDNAEIAELIMKCPTLEARTEPKIFSPSAFSSGGDVSSPTPLPLYLQFAVNTAPN